jgi:hypothetical protein
MKAINEDVSAISLGDQHGGPRLGSLHQSPNVIEIEPTDARLDGGVDDNVVD